MATLTFEEIMDRAMNNISDVMDTRDTSIVYQAVAMSALELAYLYTEREAIDTEGYADTASRPSLIKICKDRNIYPKQPTNAEVRGEFNIDVEIGTRFKCDTKTFVVSEKMEGDHVYKLTCEETGPIEILGDLLPVSNIEKLEKAKITKILLNGENEEDTEHLRQRYFNSFNYQAFGGNRRYYKDKAMELQDIGGVRVYRVKSAENQTPNVRMIIINSTYDGADEELVKATQKSMDPTQDQEGLGIVPIGHVCKVEGVKKLNIDVAFNLTLSKSIEYETISEQINEVIEDYLKTVCYAFGDSDFDPLIVRVSQIETRITNIHGVVDIENTTLNGQRKNIVLELDTIPVKGTVTNNADS